MLLPFFPILTICCLRCHLFRLLLLLGLFILLSMGLMQAWELIENDFIREFVYTASVEQSSTAKVAMANLLCTKA